jgi:ABC-type glucose/galactose transport system permease subunit
VSRERLKKLDVSGFRIPGTKIQGGRAVAVAALGLYILLFLILNNRKLRVDFVFFSVQSNELLALLVIVALGFVAGFVVGRRQSQNGSPPPPPELESGGE